MDLMLWVIKVIESCETYDQVKSVERLIKNYHELTGDNNSTNLLLEEKENTKRQITY